MFEPAHLLYRLRMGCVYVCLVLAALVATSCGQPPKAQAAAAASEAPVYVPVPVPSGDAPTAKNVILFIGDGMHLEHEIAASHYLYGTGRALSFHKFMYQTFMTTWDIGTYNDYAEHRGLEPYDPALFDPLVGYDPDFGGIAPYPLTRVLTESYFLNVGGKQPATDSASAGTALATGHKTDSGNIAWMAGDPPAGAFPGIGELMRRHRGAVFGVASTVPFSHATPAAFSSYGPDRGDYARLAACMLEQVRPNVVIGGGHPWWNGGEGSYDYGRIPEHLYEAAKKGKLPYEFAERTEGLRGEDLLAAAFARAKESSKGVFGLFGGPGGEFERPEPTGNGTAVVRRGSIENPLLAHVVTRTLDYLADVDEDKGFFIMFEQGDIDWSNHANDFKHMVGGVYDLDRAVQAAVDFVDIPGDDVDWTNTLLIVTSDHANSYLRVVEPLPRGRLPKQVKGKGDSGYGAGFHYPGGEITYSTGGHTNEPVMLYAKGDAAALFSQYEGDWYEGTRLIDNTHVFKVMAQAARVGHIQ